MTTQPPAVLADPVGIIVNLIGDLEPTLDQAAIQHAVTGVAGGRAKQRRLAQALLDDPAVLIKGRSPAPRVVGDLLIALRNAGAVGISLPVCAECGKPLRTLQRRGQDWYCGVCGPRRQACAACGKVDRVHVRDRHGRPDARAVHPRTAKTPQALWWRSSQGSIPPCRPRP